MPPKSTSALRADAESFDFVSFVDNMTAALEASTSAAAQLPDKSDMGFHRTLDRKFAKGIDDTSARILKLTNQLLELAAQSADPDAETKKNIRTSVADEDTVVDHFRSSVTDIVDTLLENADSNLDEANGRKKKAAIEVKASLAAQAGKKLPGPQAIGASKSMLPKQMMNNQTLAKPQLAFRDPINNSNDQPAWKPSLPTKHHSMVPMGWKPKKEDMPVYSAEMEPTAEKRERDMKMRDHPYFYETTNLPYPVSLFTSAPAIQPKPFEDTPFTFVDTPEQLAELTATLKNAKEIAVDLEANSTRSYYGLTCLMQISTREGDWIVDTLALRAELRDDKLGGVLADPSILKVFHGADSDIVWLQRDFDIYVVNLFDTYHACKVLEFPQFSLASLLKLYCDFDADKRYQMADWRIRPIPEEMLFYARSDTHFLLYIYDSLRNALIARASRTPSPALDSDDGASPKPNPQRAIRQVLERSAETALKLWTFHPYDHEKGLGMNGWANQAKKLGKKNAVVDEVLFTFQRLHFWRDNLARELDESPHYVLPNHVLVELARLRPRNATVVTRKLAHGAPIAEAHSAEIAEVINQAVADFAAGVTDAKIDADVVMKDASTSKPTANAPKTRGATAAATPKAAVSAASEEPSSKRAKTSARPAANLWADAIMGKADRATVSSLFGGKPAKAAPAASARTQTSSLFGSTLKKSGKGSKLSASASEFKPSAATGTSARTRMASPGFMAIQAAIHGALVPAPASTATTPVEPNQVSDTPSAGAPGVAEPETVEFIPAAKRNIVGSAVAGGATSAATGAGASVDASSSAAAGEVGQSGKAATVNAEGIVSVKKKKAKKHKQVESSAAASAESTPAPETDAAAAPKTKKEKVSADAIPEFDYAAEPDLLDDPMAGSRVKAKQPKKKKAGAAGANDKKKKPADGIDTSAFRRPPSDPTQPKSGNRSGTFTR